MYVTDIIERIARHKALRHINYAFIAALIISSLFAVRETIGMFSPDRAQEVSSPGSQDEATGPGQAPAVKALSHYAPMVENNVFGIEGQKLTPITGEQLEKAAPAEVNPTVKISLLGTVAWSDNTGYAFIMEGGTEQKMYKSGQDVPGAGVLKEVYPDLIVMDYNGNVYEVELDSFGEDGGEAPARPSRSRRQGLNKSSGKDFSQFARRTGEHEYVVSKRAIDESMQNPQNVLTDARLLPNMAGGAQNGFRVLEIKRGGLYENLGLNNGDVLLAVNDFRLSSPESALQAFTTLQGASSIKLEVERAGKKILLKYNIR